MRKADFIPFLAASVAGARPAPLPMMKLADESAISDVAESEGFGFVRYWAIAALSQM